MDAHTERRAANVVVWVIVAHIMFFVGLMLWFFH